MSDDEPGLDPAYSEQSVFDYDHRAGWDVPDCPHYWLWTRAKPIDDDLSLVRCGRGCGVVRRALTFHCELMAR